MVYHQKDSLSQNFIKYSGLVKELIDASDLTNKDLVVEIGPGRGIITKELIKICNKVIAVEKDKNLFNDLIIQFKDTPKLKIVLQDFLQFNLPATPYKVFSNIPFSITSEIINKFLKSNNLPDSIYMIMQQEAAEKYLGYPLETQNSVLVKPWYEVEILGEIDRSNFTLKPQVKIVFIKFKKRELPFIKSEDRQSFRDFVVYGFNQWQPTIFESYKNIFSYHQIKIIKKTLKIDDLKPSEVDSDKWINLYKTYKNIVSPEKKEKIVGFEKRIKLNTKF